MSDQTSEVEEEHPAINNHKENSRTPFTLIFYAMHLAVCRGNTCGVRCPTQMNLMKVFGLVWTVLVYLLLSFLRKLSGNPPLRWVITQAGRSDFMAADWKMALCSTSIYIGKC